jgi:hypothetical protein
MDVTQALRDAENSLRDFIAAILSKVLGPDWLKQSGLSQERLEKILERKAIEVKRQESGVVEERLIYYADFYDLKTILKKNWDNEFSAVFGDWKTLEVWLTELEKLRDPDAHRRDLLPHQKHLAIGISGEIRTRIVRYRSRKETTEDCFPRIESVRDNLGNIWVHTAESAFFKYVLTKMTLRPGDTIDFIITASDPEDLPLEYGISLDEATKIWQQSGEFQAKFTDKHITEHFEVRLFIRSPRSYHASGSYDDRVIFSYHVFPGRM